MTRGHLHHRSAGFGALSSLTKLLLAAAPGLASAYIERQVIELEMYRTTFAADNSTFENINAAGLVGILKKIHTEAVAEHALSPPDRLSRFDGTDVIVRAVFQVKNTVLPQKLQLYQDFGPFMAFSKGQTLDDTGLEYLTRFGDFVGLQPQQDQRWPYAAPYFWYSLPGYCPNLLTSDKAGGRQAQQSINRVCAGLQETACKNTPVCRWSWTGNTLTSCSGTDLVPACFNYSAQSGQRGVVLGGLCTDPATGAVTSNLPPSGNFGCTYTYSQVSNVSIDVLAEITSQDCGGRLCNSWLDFRLNCSEPSYRRQFDAGSGEIIDVSFCVEYDIHPYCASDCQDPQCTSLDPSARELGLPFWQGRCDASANAARAARLANLFQIEGAMTEHRLVSQQIWNLAEPCVKKVPGLCAPAPGEGGMYCSREWSGVCQPCYIPGTVADYPAKASQPMCPWDILSKPDYAGKFIPTCATTVPKDLCCLYSKSCGADWSIADKSALPLDDNGLAIAQSGMSNDVMVSFLANAAAKRGMSINSLLLQDFAYTLWGRTPTSEVNFEKTIKKLVSAGVATPAPTTTTGSPASAATTAVESSGSQAAAASAATAANTSSSTSWILWVLLSVAGALVLGFVAVSLWCFLHRKKFDSEEHTWTSEEEESELGQRAPPQRSQASANQSVRNVQPPAQQYSTMAAATAVAPTAGGSALPFGGGRR